MDVKVALADTSAHNYSQLDGQDDGKVVPALYDSGSDVPFTDPPYPFLDGADGAWHESMLAYASESSMRETASRATVAEEDYGVWYVVALRYGLLTLISQVYVCIRLTLPYFQSADPVESRKGGSCYRSFRFSFLEWQLAGSCLHFQIQAESALACSLSARARTNFEWKTDHIGVKIEGSDPKQ